MADMKIEDLERLIATYVAVHFDVTFEEVEPRLFTLSTRSGKRFSLLHPTQQSKTWVEMGFKGALVLPQGIWEAKTRIAGERGLAFSLAVADKELEIWLAKWRAPFPVLDTFEGKSGAPFVWVPTSEFTEMVRDRGEEEKPNGSV